jgi:hypothetical protein
MLEDATVSATARRLLVLRCSQNIITARVESTYAAESREVVAVTTATGSRDAFGLMAAAPSFNGESRIGLASPASPFDPSSVKSSPESCTSPL